MITKDDLLASMLRECDIALHLHGKIPAGGLDFRFSPSQRSTLELLRYLASCGIGGTLAMIQGGWDGYRAAADKVKNMSADGFPAAMAAQKAALVKTFGELSADDFAKKEATHPMGGKLPLKKALLEMPYSWLVAYRMQLYLQIKAAGNNEIWTPNCWAGVDVERQVKA